MPQAVNPYNFVPFGGVPMRKPLDEYYADPASLLTGWIDVAVIAKTPVIVPDGAKYREELPGGETDEEKAHKIYTFFQKPDGRYAIPGSGIRGVLRSAYEAVTNSCLPFVMDNKPISQRMPLYSAFPYHGLLGYDAAGGRWNLYQAQEYCYRTTKASVSHGVFRMPHCHIDFHTGDHVQFRLGSNGDIQDMLPYHAPMPRGWREGWLQFNIPVSGIRRGVPLPYYVRVLVSTGTVLHSCPVGGNVQDAELYQSIYYPLYDTVHVHGGESLPTAHDLLNALEQAAHGGGNLVPVYYLPIVRGAETIYYLSGSAAGRVRQKRKWEDILGADNQYGDHSACEQLSALCPTCALFGTAKAEEQVDDPYSGKREKVTGTRGRLRFTDAVAEGSPKPKTHDLQILSGPRTSAYEFYLKQPEEHGSPALYWNFDFFSIKSPTGRTAYFDLPKATPRGRKFYWHSSNLIADTPTEERNQMNATMDALPTGTTFHFRIYFDQITREQVNDLIWLITLGENEENGKLWYKLGHAKPLGYGSVKMLVTDCQTRKLAFDGETVSMRVEPLYKKRVPRQPSCDLSRGGSEAVKAFLAMCDSAWTENIPVEYPRGADGMIYTWFRENRTINQRHPYPDTLPCPETLSDSASVFPTLDVGSLAPRQKAETAADSAPETETTATTDLVQETRDSAAPISPLEILRMVSDKTVVECKVKRVNGRKADVEMFGITGTMKLPAKVNCKVGEVVKGKITRYNSGTLDLEWVKP